MTVNGWNAHSIKIQEKLTFPIILFQRFTCSKHKKKKILFILRRSKWWTEQWIQSRIQAYNSWNSSICDLSLSSSSASHSRDGISPAPTDFLLIIITHSPPTSLPLLICACRIRDLSRSLSPVLSTPSMNASSPSPPTLPPLPPRRVATARISTASSWNACPRRSTRTPSRRSFSTHPPMKTTLSTPHDIRSAPPTRLPFQTTCASCSPLPPGSISGRRRWASPSDPPRI